MEKEMKKELTPAEQMGLKVGDKVRVIESGCFYTKGEIRTLIEDDGSSNPWFSPAQGRELKGLGRTCISLNFVEKIEEEPKVKNREGENVEDKIDALFHSIEIVRLAAINKMPVEQFHAELFRTIALIRLRLDQNIIIEMPCPELAGKVVTKVEFQSSEQQKRIPVEFPLEDFKELLLFLAYTRPKETSGINLSGAYYVLDEVAKKLNIESPGRSDSVEEEPPEEL